MQEFYKQVQVDERELRFFAMCPICTRRHYSHRLPLICRIMKSPSSWAKGPTSKWLQPSFNKSHVTAVQDLAKQFNYCRNCGKWVCDVCFHPANTDGICKKCEAENNQ